MRTSLGVYPGSRVCLKGKKTTTKNTAYHFRQVSFRHMLFMFLSPFETKEKSYTQKCLTQVLSETLTWNIHLTAAFLHTSVFTKCRNEGLCRYLQSRTPVVNIFSISTSQVSSNKTHRLVNPPTHQALMTD